MIFVAAIAFLLALLPCALFLRNLAAYRAPTSSRNIQPRISVLIPARNEEANIGAAIKSVLASRDADFEVVVLDDHSTDRTAEIVRRLAAESSKVRFESAPPLPHGWCGKQHACASLAALAHFPILVFMDADVRLAPDALARMTAILDRTDVALASGVPRQVLGTFWEKCLIPLIHFVLLGFLPIGRMRRSTAPAYAAGCGQLFVARADAYAAAGGHAAIRRSLHDGIKLPRTFREHGFKTDLFDATDIASCRMFRGGGEVLAGLARNATEGLAAPARIVPITLLLLAGQVLPFVLIFLGEGAARFLAVAAAALAIAPRLAGALRFGQPLLSALLHPFAILVLLGIQWSAALRALRGKPATWRGRAYAQAAAIAIVAAPVLVLGNTNSTGLVASFELKDQHGTLRSYSFPRTNVTFLVVADHKGSEQLEKWIRPVFEKYRSRIAIEGIADVSAVPAGLRSFVQRAFLKKLAYPVMLDWTGDVAPRFKPVKNVANVFVIAPNGAVKVRLSGPAEARRVQEVVAVLEKELAASR